MSEQYFKERIKYLEAVLYGIVCKFPNGIEVSEVMIDAYQNNEYDHKVGISKNVQRGTYIFYKKQ